MFHNIAFTIYITDDLDPRKKEINLANLLTMSAGFKWNDWGPILWEWAYSRDWAGFTLNLPLENIPGDKFIYNSSTSHLLSIILSKSTNVSTLDFADNNLFKPFCPFTKLYSVTSWWLNENLPN